MLILDVLIFLLLSLFPREYVPVFLKEFQQFRNSFACIRADTKDLFAAGKPEPLLCLAYIRLRMIDLGNDPDHLTITQRRYIGWIQRVRFDGTEQQSHNLSLIHI